jgi:hypothetical protein
VTDSSANPSKNLSAGRATERVSIVKVVEDCGVVAVIRMKDAARLLISNVRSARASR